MGSLPGRRLAARILAHGAREAVRRHDAGDRGSVGVLARPGIRTTLDLLLGDRLVDRGEAIAGRGRGGGNRVGGGGGEPLGEAVEMASAVKRAVRR